MDEELKVLTGHNGNGPIIVSIGVPTGAPATNAETTNTQLYLKLFLPNANTNSQSQHGALLTDSFWVITIFAFLDIATSSAIIYRSKLVNANDMLNDEMKRDLQSLTLEQFLSLQLVVLVNAHCLSGWLCSVIVRQIIAMLS
eukprot:scaffold624_cov207-Chaetoceros_neogracile.AAC.8